MQREDIVTFVDLEKLRMGDDWKRKLEDTIKESRAFLFIMNKDIMHSEVSNWELSFAHKHGIPILPVQIENFAVHAMFEEKYGHYNRLIFDQQDFEQSASIIIDHIKALRIEDPELAKEPKSDSAQKGTR